MSRTTGTIAGVLVLLWGHQALAGPRYAIIDLGTFQPMAIANDGTMAGSIVEAGQFAARGQANDVQNFEVLGRADAQSLAGTTVGYSGCYDPGCINQEATLWDDQGTAVLLGLLPGGSASAATCISGSEYGGYGDDASLVAQPLWFTGGQIEILATLGNGGYVDGCNSLRQRVGLVNTAQFLSHASLWDTDGTLHDLGTLGGTQSALAAINEVSEATGWSTDAAGALQAVRWTVKTGLQVLPPPAGHVSCQGRGLNVKGMKVGGCDAGQGYPLDHAVVWNKSTKTGIDLNTLVTNGTDWVLESATGVNDTAMIVGLGTYQGQLRGFLLVPTELQNFPGLWQWLGLPPLP